MPLSLWMSLQIEGLVDGRIRGFLRVRGLRGAESARGEERRWKEKRGEGVGKGNVKGSDRGIGIVIVVGGREIEVCFSEANRDDFSRSLLNSPFSLVFVQASDRLHETDTDLQ